jgi:hypothetical protein
VRVAFPFRVTGFDRRRRRVDRAGTLLALTQGGPGCHPTWTARARSIDVAHAREGNPMKLRATLLACLAFVALALPAAAHEIQYSAILTGAAEIPANASPGTGSVLVTVDFDLFTMRVEADFSGLTGTTTASHIHCCTVSPGAANVGVATTTPSFTGFPLGVTSGTYDHTFDMALASSYNAAFVTAQGGVSNAFNALVAGMTTGNAYFNIHTSTFGGGEIRGLLTEVVPEPSAALLLSLGLAGLGWMSRRLGV